MKTAIPISRSIISHGVINRILERTVAAGECLVWQGCTSKSIGGYGRISVDNRDYGVHRVIFTWFNRELLNNEIVMHSCDNSLCCNYRHMTGGTQLDNVRDMINKQRDRKAAGKMGETHPKAAITNKQAKWIRDNYRPGRGEMSGMSIARKLSVSSSCVYRVINNERYKDAV